MKAHHQRRWRKLLHSALLFALVLTTLPQSLFAQAVSISIYLPQINGGLGQSENVDPPFTGFEEGPEEQLETILLTEAASELPEPAQLAATPGAPAISADQDL